MIKYKDIIRFVEGHYYCDEPDELEEGEERTIWAPFEDESLLEIQNYIDSDVENLISFLKENNVEVR